MKSEPCEFLQITSSPTMIISKKKIEVPLLYALNLWYSK